MSIPIPSLAERQTHYQGLGLRRQHTQGNSLKHRFSLMSPGPKWCLIAIAVVTTAMIAMLGYFLVCAMGWTGEISKAYELNAGWAL